jgi:hypothetical protein
MDKKEYGYWSIASHKHLKEFKGYSPQLNKIDNISMSGKSGRFVGAIRGNGVIENIEKIETVANSIGIQRIELHKIILPELEKNSDQKIEIIRNSIGEITGISEYVFTATEALNIAGNVLINQSPTDVELSTLNSLDMTRRIPFLESELIEKLSRQGYKETDIKLALAIQQQFKLLQKLEFSKSKEPIYSNEYVWGTNNNKIAATIASIDIADRATLSSVIEIIQGYQGHPIELLPTAGKDLLLLAEKTGMINNLKIHTLRGVDKAFAFSPNLMEPISYNDDILDDVKLLLASLRFGENYTLHSRINDVKVFLQYLISYGEIGPHDANATDYMMLEKSGIVKVERKRKLSPKGYYREGYYLKLIKKDVAEEALKYLNNPDSKIIGDNEIIDFSAMTEVGSYMTSEASRIALAESPEHVKEAEDYIARVLRDELL